MCYNCRMTKGKYTSEKICLTCNAKFATGSSGRKHCSIECRLIGIAKQFSGVDGCWEWPNSLNPMTGYGQLSSWDDGKRKLYTAHRVSFSAFVGKIEDGLHVCHSCDNRKCFNPKHLFLGTAKDNMEDCSIKGRTGARPKPPISWQKRFPDKVPRGENHHLYGARINLGESHPLSKLTNEAVIYIRSSGEKGVVLAKKYGVTQSLISAVRKNKIWTHV